ncbi:MAG: PilZ domain-containing protein [Candidatus Sulfotelmatobacter sp.]
MGLECLVVTSDPTLLGHVQASLGTHGASLHLRQDSASAIEFVSRRHLDGLVIDCDDVPGGTKALSKLRKAPANKQTLILAVVKDWTSTEEALDLGADFVLCKPIQQTRLRSVVDIAMAKMEREHRRYFRYEVDLPVQFRNPLGHSFTGRMQNVSEGGLSIKLMAPVSLTGVVNVEFELPSVEPQAFYGKADIVWSDSFMMGLRFLYIEKHSGIALQTWLSSLEARSRFHETDNRTC